MFASTRSRGTREQHTSGAAVTRVKAAEDSEDGATQKTVKMPLTHTRFEEKERGR